MRCDVFYSKIMRLCSSCFIVATAVLSVSGQTHFTFTSLTGNNMSVMVPASINPTVNGSPISNGDEIGVFAIDSADTPSVLCAGAMVWRGGDWGLTVWGDNDLTPVKDGMHAGDTLTFRVWDSSSSTEIPATVTYSLGGPTYSVNGMAILASLIAPPLPQKPLLVSPANVAAINADSVVFVWFIGTPLINQYSLEIATDSLMTAIISVDSSLTDTTDIYKGLTGGMTYWWRVRAHNGSGWGDYSDTFKFTVNMTAVTLPKSYSLNYFSVSHEGSLIKYSLAAPSQVSIKVYAIQGKLIKSMVNAYQAAGYYQVPVNLDALSKGFYVLSFTAGNQVIRKKMVNF
jgi:hypothetical protein